MKRLFITTTNHIDNGKAVAYHGVVSSHLVAGTGFLSDLAAGFTDIFGGRSNTYRKHMEELYDEALDEISEKAQLLGANAVLGHKNEPDRKFCSNCNENIKGLTQDDINNIETFKKRVAVLKELLQK